MKLIYEETARIASLQNDVKNYLPVLKAIHAALKEVDAKNKLNLSENIGAVWSIAGTNNISEYIKRKVVEAIPEKELKIGSVKLTRESLISQIEEPYLGSLPGVIAQHSSHYARTKSDARFYKVENGTVEINQEELDASGESYRKYARTEEEIAAFEVFENFLKAWDELNELARKGGSNINPTLPLTPQLYFKDAADQRWIVEPVFQSLTAGIRAGRSTK